MPDVIKNIVKTETSKGEKKILDVAPEVDMSLLKDLTPPKSTLLLILKTFFAILVIVSIGALAFFTSQLTDRLDFLTDTFKIPNISHTLAADNSEIKKLQTELNSYRYLQIKGYLDEFSFSGDSYIKSYEVANSQTVSSSQKRSALKDMAKLRENLTSAFLKVSGLITKKTTAPLFTLDLDNQPDLDEVYSTDLKSHLNGKAQTLADSPEYKAYSHAASIVGNTKLKSLIVQTDIDAMSDPQLYEFLKEMNSNIVNDLSTIHKIKDKRIRWSDVINEINLRTTAVDTYHSGNFYEELGGIRYTSYDFDSSGPSISIVGETKRFDTTNFTMIVNLIDELNRSVLFEDADMRSFNKSGSLDDGYTASLRLVLGLEGMNSEEEAAPVADISGELKLF